MTDGAIRDKGTLRAHYGEINERAAKKVMPKLDRHSRRFIELSPLAVVATGTRETMDASPKGDAPGFVRILDDSTLLVPDRPGNNRVDGFQNILENPRVGLLFFVPGVNETLRVNGTAEITTDRRLLEPMAVRGRLPRSGLLVHVEETFFHCGKALIRSKLWDPASQIERSEFPSLGCIFTDQIADYGPGDRERVEAAVEEGYRNNLY